MFIDAFMYDEDDKYSKVQEELDKIYMICWSVLVFIIILLFSLWMLM